ncbi:MAG: hypothetical protein LBB76_09905, partial [Azoarcus sp.]|nr:hypothetical protein [Azoarcus sp.]
MNRKIAAEMMLHSIWNFREKAVQVFPEDFEVIGFVVHFIISLWQGYGVSGKQVVSVGKAPVVNFVFEFKQSAFFGGGIEKGGRQAV